MKKILVLGGSQIQLPTISLAKKMGLEVVVVDYDDNCASRAFADYYEKVSTVDFQGCLNTAIKYSIDYVIAPSIDLPVRVMAYIAKKIGLPCYLSQKTANIATNKFLIHEILKKNGMNVPKYQIVSGFNDFRKKLDNFNMPVVVKPLDSAGQKVYLLRDKGNIESAYRLVISLGTFNKKEILLEEYIAGKEFCVSGFSIKGAHYFPMITETIANNPPPYIGITIGHIYPSGLSKKEEEEIRTKVSLALDAIGLKNGPSYTQLFIKDGRIYISEIAARVGGGQDSKQAKLAFGIDFDRLALRFAMGKAVKKSEVIPNKLNIPAVYIKFIKPLKKGKLVEVKGIEDACRSKGINEISLYKNIGDILEKPKYGRDRVGYIVSVGNDRKEAVKNSADAESLLELVTK